MFRSDERTLVDMASGDTVGPAQLVLMASVARRHYLDGRSKIEIAEEFGLSRFKVARLIDTARRSGLVRIEIRHEGGIDLELSARVRDRFGLRHAIVVDTPDDDPHALRRHLGRAAAELLGEVITPQDVLGLAWAHSVRAMARVMPRLPAIPVVQLTGAMPDGNDSAIDIVRDVARASGGPAYVFYAPFVVADAATARALRRQPEVARAFARLPSVTRAVVGIGLWAPGLSTLYDTADTHEHEILRRLGVCAEVSGVFLGADGKPVETGLTARMIAMDAGQMRAIPEVIALPHGPAKVPAVLAALRSGLVTGLVTHAPLANGLLADP
jgi:DNA-binding transcriptional regulator LsrR (DeoR family)